MGLTQTSIYLSRFQGDKVEDKNEITVSAVLIPDFSRLSAQQLQQAPRMTLSEDAVKFNMSDGKEKKDATIIISNEGASNLEISSLQLFNRAISASLSRRIIKPGSTSKLEIEVEARYLKSAKGQPRVLMITNDPTCPKKIIPVDITD
jgi:P pilus assembly chaperone PapD